MALPDTFFADRSDRGKLRFTGPQRAWFLHQILTQSFEDIGVGEPREAALLTPHGRMMGYLEALATEEAILCHFESELSATLPDAIRKYVLATDVQIDDVTDRMGLVLVGGVERSTAEGLPGVQAVQPTRSVGIDAAYLWMERSDTGRSIEALRRLGASEAAESDLESCRVAAGVARWGFDMNEKTIPQEAGVDEWAIHYSKGCYVGQEAMAKIHFRGKPNRRLARLEAESDLQRGAEVLVDGSKIGSVTTAAGTAGLAIVRHDVEAGTAVEVDRARALVVA
ncbi:MAG: hypothetical protein M3290_00785 [Actinomycetota bacterium]|nr:hypothetical protein [Actinomycetota bacterium]